MFSLIIDLLDYLGVSERTKAIVCYRALRILLGSKAIKDATEQGEI